MLPIFINLLLAIHVIVSLLIVFLVLMQRPKNEGLGAAFGGGMTENLFGAQTTNVLQTITRYLGAAFFGLTLLLSWLYVKQSSNTGSMQQRLSVGAVAPASPAPISSPAAIATPAPENAASPQGEAAAGGTAPMLPAQTPDAGAPVEAPASSAPASSAPASATPSSPSAASEPAAVTTPATPAPNP
jgi:preprotein translocase subunit SecG